MGHFFFQFLLRLMRHEESSTSDNSAKVVLNQHVTTNLIYTLRSFEGLRNQYGIFQKLSTERRQAIAPRL